MRALPDKPTTQATNLVVKEPFSGVSAGKRGLPRNNEATEPLELQNHRACGWEIGHRTEKTEA